ncbi:MAG: NACHT domain-containing NTPase [Okeania sp. SIO3I5]|uniref:NACHT domain-containing protein n=1 Tax=Okeania sp. SIO3I5 TaxID=2607805 RepID=UPI0013B5EF54|nr:NACHT domain-containing NTPase [Okeania sp. SIO3I5]NEQ36273.1 NACHT domain-containing NTPase [Okeania sp. SIO3I5]
MLDFRKSRTRLFVGVMVIVSGTLLSGVTGGITGAIAALATSIITPDVLKLLIRYRGGKMLNLEQALDFVENLSRQHRDEGLSNLERDIFQGIWQNQTFKEIAQSYSGADRAHIERNAAPALYKFLSRVTGEKVNKRTLQSAINVAYKGQQKEPDLESLVKITRSKVKNIIQRECGTMRVLDMCYPIGLDDIYTEVNILQKVTSKNREELETLAKTCQPKDFDRLGYGAISKSRVPALKAVNDHEKLFVLGKPGAGKTTFLKHLANQCNEGYLKSDLVLIFITLREFALAEGQPNLLTYIQKRFQAGKVADQEVESLLRHGKFFLLLDGLDEVKAEENRRVINRICSFVQRFPENRFVITCRIAAREYVFDQFTEVEVADFTEEQIRDFVRKWFRARVPREAKELTDKFHQKLNGNKPSKELASNPLLLTLLCLVFEELKSFPRKRSQLYQEGLELLLKKWDSKRNIERPELYKKLEPQQKEDLLSYIAYKTFAQAKLFFAQEEVESYIIEYIRSLPEAQTDPKELRLDSAAVLKGIEAQHGILVERAKGIYSFSHLTFQEYFTARYIVNSPDPQRLDQAFQQLVGRIANKQWREVFLIAVEMMPNADYLLKLMKQKVDAIVAGDAGIQECLDWVNQKTNSVEHPYKAAAVRTNYIEPALEGYFSHFLCEDRCLPYDISIDISLKVDLGFVLDPKQNRWKNFNGLDYCLDRTIDEKIDRDLYFPFKPGQLEDRNEIKRHAKQRNRFELLNHTLEILEKHGRDPELKEEVQQLKNQIPSELDPEASEKWWQENRHAWAEQLRNIMIRYRNIGHDWQFTDEQYELLKDYYNSNLLLVQCLKQSRYVSREVRQEIEDTLLLPIVSGS